MRTRQQSSRYNAVTRYHNVTQYKSNARAPVRHTIVADETAGAGKENKLFRGFDINNRSEYVRCDGGADNVKLPTV